MKSAAKSGFWLLITTWGLMFIFFMTLKTVHDGLLNIFLNICCNNGFDLIEISRAIVFLIIFNIVLSVMFFLQTN